MLWDLQEPLGLKCISLEPAITDDELDGNYG